VKKAFKRHFPEKKEFDQFLVENLKIDKNELLNKNISRFQIEQVCKNFMQRYILKHIRQKDIEGFLSAFVYNQKGFIKTKSLSKMLYEFPFHTFH